MFISFVDVKRKTLETGAVPTENLPSKSHDSKPSSRRSLVKPVAGSQFLGGHCRKNVTEGLG